MCREVGLTLPPLPRPTCSCSQVVPGQLQPFPGGSKGALGWTLPCGPRWFQGSYSLFLGGAKEL